MCRSCTVGYEIVSTFANRRLPIDEDGALEKRAISDAWEMLTKKI